MSHTKNEIQWIHLQTQIQMKKLNCKNKSYSVKKESERVKQKCMQWIELQTQNTNKQTCIKSIFETRTKLNI